MKMKPGFLLLSVSVLALYSSCCTKKACPETHALSFKFYGFRAEDVDTVEMTGYAIGSNFGEVSIATAKYNASLFRGEDSSYNLVSSYGFNFDDHAEWRLYIPATGKAYTIGNYIYNSYSCNNCPLNNSDKVKTLAQCDVNGMPSSTLVTITK